LVVSNTVGSPLLGAVVPTAQQWLSLTQETALSEPSDVEGNTPELQSRPPLVDEVELGELAADVPTLTQWYSSAQLMALSVGTAS
jgi:hypothetical protein